MSLRGALKGGWCLLLRWGRVERVFIVLHGYGGREGPDDFLPFENAALFFPMARGIGRSARKEISSDPIWHVLHDIQDRKRYVHGGCVEDVWLAVSSALRLFPGCAGRVGLLGISFGGGIGAMALGFDRRIARAHLTCLVSAIMRCARLFQRLVAARLQIFCKRRPNSGAEETLAYHDAALAAKRIAVPTHFACARFDPMVAPPGQFAVYNAVVAEKELFVLNAPDTMNTLNRSSRASNCWKSLMLSFATLALPRRRTHPFLRTSSMNREYHKWWSPNLSRDMELLVFGHSGAKVLVFPTRGGRFYEYREYAHDGSAATKDRRWAYPAFLCG